MSARLSIHNICKAKKQAAAYIASAVIIFFCLTSSNAFTAKKDKSTPPVTKLMAVSGEIGIIKPHYITVIYKKEKGPGGVGVKDYEMLFPIDDNIELLHRKNIGQLQEGDIIQVLFDQTSYTDKKGVGRIERKAKQIKFIKAAPRGLRSQ